MSFIHGVDEADLGKLRRFVNQIIHKKPEEFKYIENLDPGEIEKIEALSNMNKSKNIDQNTNQKTQQRGETEVYQVKKNTSDRRKSKL